MISQNELLTDDDELKRLPYKSGKEVKIYAQSKLYIIIYYILLSIYIIYYIIYL